MPKELQSDFVQTIEEKSETVSGYLKVQAEYQIDHWAMSVEPIEWEKTIGQPLGENQVAIDSADGKAILKKLHDLDDRCEAFEAIVSNKQQKLADQFATLIHRLISGKRFPAEYIDGNHNRKAVEVSLDGHDSRDMNGNPYIEGTLYVYSKDPSNIYFAVRPGNLYFHTYSHTYYLDPATGDFVGKGNHLGSRHW